MSSGNIVTEYSKQEMATEAAILRASALVSNGVLRRALAIAAYECAGHDGSPDAGVALMITWVMRASDELEELKSSGQETVNSDQLSVKGQDDGN